MEYQWRGVHRPTDRKLFRWQGECHQCLHITVDRLDFVLEHIKRYGPEHHNRLEHRGSNRRHYRAIHGYTLDQHLVHTLGDLTRHIATDPDIGSSIALDVNILGNVHTGVPFDLARNFCRHDDSLGHLTGNNDDLRHKRKYDDRF